MQSNKTFAISASVVPFLGRAKDTKVIPLSTPKRKSIQSLAMSEAWSIFKGWQRLPLKVRQSMGDKISFSKALSNAWETVKNRESERKQNLLLANDSQFQKDLSMAAFISHCKLTD